MTIDEIKANILDVKAWMHYYAPEPLKDKLDIVIKEAEYAIAIREAALNTSLASDGLEMIQSAMHDE